MAVSGMALAVTIFFAICGCSPKAPPEQGAARETAPPSTAIKPAATASESIAVGTRWLLAQQAEDGGWHSSVYGQMRGGVGDTGLAVYALSRAQKGMPDGDNRKSVQAGVARGAKFLFAQLADPEHSELRDGADYPTYAAALLLLSLPESHGAGSPEREPIERVLAYMRSSQQTAPQGWKPEDLQFGGWNQTGGAATDAQRPGNTNVSVTCFALEALRAHQTLDEATSAAALQFLGRCQNFDEWAADAHRGDGGFFFTPEADDPLNKAGVESGATPPRPHSYGSPTADGLCALAACGVKANDARAAAAIDWLARQDKVDVVPGFAAPESEGEDEPDGASAAEGLRFYYYAALARVIRAYPEAKFAERKTELIAEIIRRQRPDGSWQNANNVMREDDPLIATSLAIAALGILSAK
ncbi:MAG TPA: hypothetical protein VGJ26_14550 [Pirellulales bacterium]